MRNAGLEVLPGAARGTAQGSLCRAEIAATGRGIHAGSQQLREGAQRGSAFGKSPESRQ